MSKIFKNFTENLPWEEKAKINPLFAVMSEEKFRDSTSDLSEEEILSFYKQGERMVKKWIVPWLNSEYQLGQRPNVSDLNILEFGCGMGRLLNGLKMSTNINHLFGIDISRTMIELAEKNTIGIKYDISKSDLFPYNDNTFDRIYSYAVFQHILSKSSILKSISEIARVLKIGGRILIQFLMIAPPPPNNTSLKDSYAFEKAYIYYGFHKRYKIPYFNYNKANNWQGNRLGYNQLFRHFKINGIKIYGTKCESIHRENMVWFYGEKVF